MKRRPVPKKHRWRKRLRFNAFVLVEKEGGEGAARHGKVYCNCKTCKWWRKERRSQIYCFKTKKERSEK